MKDTAHQKDWQFSDLVSLMEVLAPAADLEALTEHLIESLPATLKIASPVNTLKIDSYIQNERIMAPCGSPKHLFLDKIERRFGELFDTPLAKAKGNSRPSA